MRYSELTNIAPEIGPGRNPCDDVAFIKQDKTGLIKKNDIFKDY
jgi:hypothetical protein